MHTRNYRMIVLGCMLSWFMLGMHIPTLHRLTEHGDGLPLDVILFTMLFAVSGVAALWALLKPRPR